MKIHSSTTFIACALGLASNAAAEPVHIQLQSRSSPHSAHKASARAHLRLKRGTSQVSLTDWISTVDLQWYGQVSVGTPPQNFSVIFDTGSNDLIIPRSNCTNCANQTKFDSSKSTSFSLLPGIATGISFGTASDAVPLGENQNVTGVVVTDTVNIGGLSIDKQTLLLADVVAPVFNSMPADGVLGLPPTSASHLSSNQTQPFYWALNSTGHLTSSVFSFYLNTGASGAGQGGQLTLGGIDDSKHDGPINYVGLNATLVQSFGEWLINAPVMTVNGNTTVLSDASSIALLDTGTAYILAPDANTAKAIYAAVSPKIRQIDPKGAWGAECDVFKGLSPSLTFTLADASGGKLNVTVDKNAFNVGPYPGQKGICQAVVLHPEPAINVGVPFWTIGSPLLKQYYTVWDATAQKIGFGNLKVPSNTPTPSPSGTTSGTPPPTSSKPSSGDITRPAGMAAMVIAGVAAVAALL